MSFPFALTPPSPLEYFRALVQDAEQLPLFEAAASLAQDSQPDLDLSTVCDEMDLLAARLQRRLPADAPDLQKLLGLNHYFYRDLQFAGNVNDFYDPQNSFLHAVLRTRRGIPVSLAVLWLEFAERLGLEANGVSFPHHFLIKVTLPQGQVVLDPMTGQSLTREDLLDRLGPQKVSVLGADEEEVPLGLFLQNASAVDILERMLRNLRELYASQLQHERELAVLNRLLILLPESWVDYRHRAQALVAVGELDAALKDLQTYLQARGDEAPDAAAVQAQIDQIQGKS